MKKIILNFFLILIFSTNLSFSEVIDEIKIIGNKRISDRKLKQVIASREKRWWAFLSSADKYDENRLKFDKKLLN